MECWDYGRVDASIWAGEECRFLYARPFLPVKSMTVHGYMRVYRTFLVPYLWVLLFHSLVFLQISAGQAPLVRQILGVNDAVKYAKVVLLGAAKCAKAAKGDPGAEMQ